jgi:hypothetical protein
MKPVPCLSDSWPLKMLINIVGRHLCLHKRKVSIQEIVRICSDIGDHYIQGEALTAALKEVIHPSKKGGNDDCFTCRQLGHFAKECHKGKRLPLPSRTEIVSFFPGSGAQPPGVCPWCCRGRHWANECCSQTDVAVPYKNGGTPGGAHPIPIKQ